MTRARLVIALTLLLVAGTTFGAVVATGERDRTTLAGPEAAASTSRPAARTGPTAAPPRPRPTTSPTPGPTARPSMIPTSKPSAAPTARTTSKPSAKPKVQAGSGPSAKRGRVVYLTFDDGPGPSTPQVLEVLRRTGSTATFFQLGVNVRGRQQVQAAIRAQGSGIGNHTWSHPDLNRLDAADLRRQIAQGPRSRCVRPPYGATNAAVRAAIERVGARQVLWTVDSEDWTKPGVRSLERLGSSRLVRPGSIVLMHDGGGDRRQTVAALPAIIEGWQARGYVVRGLPSCR